MVAGAGEFQPVVVVAHGEGKVEPRNCDSASLLKQQRACLRYVDGQGEPTEEYPLNPNGTELGLNGFTNQDGRFTIMMPHPERIFRSVQNSWQSPEWGEYGPWMRIFRNARKWLQ